jgi:hypothetical protein
MSNAEWLIYSGRVCAGLRRYCGEAQAGTYTTVEPATWLKIRNPDCTQIRGRQEMF